MNEFQKEEALSKSDTIKVSVIVPVYNPGAGIKKCIENLTNQTLREIEILFIDDCGTDKAMSFVRRASLSDNRIRIIKNSRNLGSGQSRNIGIDAAAGEYLSFIDPDDYISPDFLELLYKKAEDSKADIVKGVLRHSSMKRGREKISPPGPLNLRIKKGLEMRKPLFSLFYFEHTTAIYRRETVKHDCAYYGLSSNAEDLVFQLRVCYGKKHIVFEDKAVYVYVERDGSNNRKTSVKRLRGEIQSVEEMLSFLEEHNENTVDGCEYLSRFVTKSLEVQKVVSRNPELRKEADDIQDELRTMLLASELTPGLKKASMVIGAFLDYDINLAALPYSRFWYRGSYSEYKEQIDIWVNFLCTHPDYEGGCQPALWEVFESAITFDDWKNEKEFSRRKALKDVRRQAHRMPDRSILTDNYVSMKLFIDYGINTFALRDSVIGYCAKRLAVLIRSYKKA